MRVNLFYYGLSDQPTRFGVFFELLKLQYSIVGILLAIPGAIWLARKAWKPFVLCAVFFLSLYLFIINTVQDVMAYLMLPFMMIAVFSGLGAWAMVVLLDRVDAAERRWVKTSQVLILAALLLLPIGQLISTYPRVSLHDYTAGGDWVNTVFDHFAGKGEHAVLLAPWEANTPLWVAKYTEGRALDPKDVTPVYVTTASQNPWLDNVFAHLNEGPVYLADYRRPVVEGRLFRLRPEGAPLWRVVPPGDTSVPQLDHALNVKAGEGENTIEVLGYSLDRDSVEAGQTAYLTLAMRAPITPTHILMPYATLGDREFRWTTDSRLLTPEWLPNEVIVERYEIPIAFDTPSGDYGLKLGFSDLTTGQDVLQPAPLQSLPITEATATAYRCAAGCAGKLQRADRFVGRNRQWRTRRARTADDHREAGRNDRVGVELAGAAAGGRVVYDLRASHRRQQSPDRAARLHAAWAARFPRSCGFPNGSRDSRSTIRIRSKCRTICRPVNTSSRQACTA